MNYAFMSFSCPKLSLVEMLATAQAYGYDGVEPRIEAGHEHGIEIGMNAQARKDARQQAVDSGIALCCIATSRRYADPEAAQQHVDDTRRCIDLAADLGSPRLRVFGGSLGEGLSREAAIDLVAKSLSAVASHAQARGVTLCMETHDDWCDPDHVVAVMQRVDHPAVAINWDVMHPVRVAGWTVDAAYVALKPWLAHMHVHDGAQAEKGIAYVPMGEGIVDTRRAIQLANAGSYEGYLSGEWINWEPYNVHLPRELATMHAYERER
jgi:sugar phosphate isomerase/epimerase